MCVIVYIFKSKKPLLALKFNFFLKLLSCLGEAGVARGGEGVKRTTVTKQQRRGSTLSHLQYWSPTSHFDRMLLQLNDAGNGNLQIMTDVVPKNAVSYVSAST